MTTFSLSEIGGGSESLLSVARRLETYSAATAIETPTSLTSSIVAAVARDAAPTPPVMFIRALSAGSVAAAMTHLAASVRAAFGVGRAFPMAVRAQAIALLLTVALVLAGGGAAFAAGAASVIRALQPDRAPQPAVLRPPAERTPSAPDRANDGAGKGAKPKAGKTPRGVAPGPRNNDNHKDDDDNRGGGDEGKDDDDRSSGSDGRGSGDAESDGAEPRDERGARDQSGKSNARRESGG